MKLILIPSLGLAGLGGPLRAGPRVFTNITGRTLSAEVVAATTDKAEKAR